MSHQAVAAASKIVHVRDEPLHRLCRRRWPLTTLRFPYQVPRVSGEALMNQQLSHVLLNALVRRLMRSFQHAMKLTHCPEQRIFRFHERSFDKWKEPGLAESLRALARKLR